MTDEDLDRLLYLGHETNGVEFKRGGRRTDAEFLARVTRAMLAMANRRDGGFVILGVEDAEQFEVVGMDEDQLSTRNFEDVSDAVNEYASPSLVFDLEVKSHHGKSLVIIEIREFDEIPILCRKEFTALRRKGPPILRRGACYVRSRRKPESVEIPTEEEMRELLDLAVDKGLARFIQRARKAGIFPSETPGSKPLSDREQFEQQRRDLP